MSPERVSFGSHEGDETKALNKEHRERGDKVAENKLKDTPKGGGTFVDAAAMKEKVRQNLSKPKISVTDYYWDTGICQKIARSPLFDKMTLTVIGLNAVWIAVDTDWNDSAILLTADPEFIVAENFFCFFFTFEWIARFGSFKKKRNCVKDAWFVFDSFMVGMMVMETWIFTIVLLCVGGDTSGGGGVMSLARLLRLSRMARMGKLLRVMPELMIMLKGMKAATRSVGFTLLLLAIITYIYGIAFTQLAVGTAVGPEHFSWVPQSMYTLLIFGIFLDNIGILSTPLKEEPVLFFVFFTFVLIGSLTVMNMLVGVLCEVVSAVAATEQEEMRVSYVQEKLSRVMAILDEDGGGTINKDEFVQILDNIEAVRCLNDVGVDVFALIDLADYIFEDDDCESAGQSAGVELDFGRFMEVVLQLRGSNQATVKDIVDLRKFMRQTMVENYNQTKTILSRIDTLQRHVTGEDLPPTTLKHAAPENQMYSENLQKNDCHAVMCEAPRISLSAEKPVLMGSWAPMGDERYEFHIPLESEVAGLTSEKDGLLWRKQESYLQLPVGMKDGPGSSLSVDVSTTKVTMDMRSAKIPDGASVDMRSAKVTDAIQISGIPRLRTDAGFEDAELEALQRQLTYLCQDVCRQLANGMNDSIATLGHSLERRAPAVKSSQANGNRL